MTAPTEADHFRRLVASADKPEALVAQRIQEAEARGRLTGLLLIRGMKGTTR